MRVQTDGLPSVQHVKSIFSWNPVWDVVCPLGSQIVCSFDPCGVVDHRELDWEFTNNLDKGHLPNQMARMNRMHRKICGIDDLIHVANEIYLFFRYQR